jgi:hypothetical protein
MNLEEIKTSNLSKKEILIKDDQGGMADKKINYLHFLRKYNGSNKNINYSCMMFFIKTFCSCLAREKNGTLKRKIFYKFYEKNMEKLDIIYVMKKLRIIDILCYLLLEPRQLVLLNYVKKEQLVVDCETGQARLNNDYCKRMSIEEENEILQNINRDTMDETDQKLLKIIEPKLKNLLLSRK